jgi:hypothetical protein
MNKYVCPTFPQRYVTKPDVSQRGLMEKDDWKNIGLANLDKNCAVNADDKAPNSSL